MMFYPGRFASNFAHQNDILLWIEIAEARNLMAELIAKNKAEVHVDESDCATINLLNHRFRLCL